MLPTKFMKKFLLIFIGLIVLSLGWFLLVKEYDYRFHFQAKYSPAVLKKELKDLKSFEVFNSSTEIYNVNTEEFNELKQKVDFGNTELNLLWEMKEANDSTSEVYIHIAGPDRIKNRLSILNPFSRSAYVDSLAAIFSKLGKGLKKKQDQYRIKIIDSIVYSPALDCICRSAENVKTSDKAMQMFRDIQYLEDFVMVHDLKLTGFPFVKITKWDRKEDMINFDFCFPINLAQDIRPTATVDFQQVNSSTSIKAIFSGNYRESDVAWHELLYEADKRNLKTSELPLEIFRDNPKEGGNALSWKADIFMPISE